MLQLRNITKQYEETIVLNNVSLSIHRGMNIIIGASGSGKSSLLKIMSGMDDAYTGEVYVQGYNIKKLSKEEKSYMYNNIFGFIWQDFHLLEDSTVLDNVLLPMQLKSEVNIKQAEKLLRDLKLRSVMYQQVKFLSGGQKQRVAIVRELMKNPQIILADEPTSALDQKTSKEIMKILRDISKSRTVVLVTHDTSQILPSDCVFELDKGELISTNHEEEFTTTQALQIKKTTLPLKHTISTVNAMAMSHKGRFLTSAFSLMLGVCFLLTTLTESIGNTSKAAFDQVFDQYGESVLDIQLYHSFTGAAGTGGDAGNQPNVDVKQDIGKIYNTYKNDERIEFIAFLDVFNQINIQYKNKKYNVPPSSDVPAINKLIAGRMPKGDGKEIVVPKSLLKTMGVTKEELLDQTITFSGSITDWTKDVPKYQNTSIEVTIVGVMDTTMTTNIDGETFEYEIEDSFLFSKAALAELLNQTNKGSNNLNMTMRTKTPADLIAIKDELNKQGIVPLGQFEVIEDLVRLQSQSTKQSSSASFLIVALVLVMVSAISLITGVLRKKEYAIFKICGFSNHNLRVLNLFEACGQMLCSLVLTMILFPLINMASNAVFGLEIITLSHSGIILLLLIGLAALSYIITEFICETTSILKALKRGDAHD